MTEQQLGNIIKVINNSIKKAEFVKPNFDRNLEALLVIPTSLQLEFLEAVTKYTPSILFAEPTEYFVNKYFLGIPIRTSDKSKSIKLNLYIKDEITLFTQD